MNKYYIVMILMSAGMLQAVFNGFDMTMDKPITGLPMIPDQLYTPADNDPVRKVKVPAKIHTKRARYRYLAYRMISTSQYNNKQFPWINYKRRNQRLENF